jgi:hypothetical protein
MDRSVAILQLSVAVTARWAKECGMSDNPRDLVLNLAWAVMDDRDSEHTKSHLSQLVKLSAVAVVTGRGTHKNGCLNAPNKL